MAKVIVVATSRKTRGGVTSVVKAHEHGQQWKDYGCEWIETHRDGNLLMKFVWLIYGLCKFLVKLPGCDLVHIHTSEPPSALRKRVFFMPLARLTGKKVIVHFHAFSPETTIKSKYKALYKYLFGKADRVIVLSGFWKREVEKAIPEAKVEIIYNPCLTEIRNKAAGSANYQDTYTKISSILFAGTINQRKGYKDLIKAFAKVVNNDGGNQIYNNWQIIFAGNGEIEDGKELAKGLGIDKQTKWLGWVNGDDKDKAFREATIFCLPSYAEGFPMSVLDAWSYGLPVITTPVGGIPDIAIDGANMLLFTPGDIDALANCIKRMIDDFELRKTISMASIDLAQTTFNINTINHQVGDLYQSVLNE